MKYQEFRSTFEDKVTSESYFELILNNAKSLIDKDIKIDTFSKIGSLTHGVANLTNSCSQCKQKFNTWFDNKEEIWMY